MNNVSQPHHRRTGTKFTIGVFGAAAVMGLAACSAGSDAHSATAVGTRSNETITRARSGYPHGITGKITTENGSTWTLNATDGTQYIVNITPQTQFGATWAPSSAQQFSVGTAARVNGTINDHTITAARVTAPRRKNPSVTPSTPPAS